ncbi:MAG: hypothetical protein ACRDNI_00630 [Gaiellaceae bacterium]
MARILVFEPNPEVRALLAHVVTRLGHEPVYAEDGPGDFLPDDADVLLIEPADRRALSVAQMLRLRHGGLPIVCTSIFPATPESQELRPVAYLVKPFSLVELERALDEAVGRVSVPA